MTADILACYQKEGWGKSSFYRLAFFFFFFKLPKQYDPCFGELLEQHRELAQLMAHRNFQKKGFCSTRYCFQEYPLEFDQLL